MSVGRHFPSSVDALVLTAVGAIWPELEGTARREEETNVVGRKWASGARTYETLRLIVKRTLPEKVSLRQMMLQICEPSDRA